MLDGRVDVHDELHAVDVHAACGDVGGDEHAHAAGIRVRAEGGEVALARVLRQVAVQVDGGNAGRGELLGELLRLVLGAGEQDAAAVSRGDAAHEGGLGLGVGRDEDAVDHRALGHRGLVDGVTHLVLEELRHEGVDATVEGGREEHALTTLRRGLEDAGHAGQESEVGHVVGFVEHRDLDAVELDDALLHEVLEATGAGHDDVDAGADRVGLRTLADAAEDGGDRQAGRIGEGLDGRRDLRGELARGGEDQSARVPAGAAGGVRAGEARDHRKRERDRLAAAGAAAAEHVTASEGVGQGVALDRERLGHAARGEGGGEGLGHAESEEGGHGGVLSDRARHARRRGARGGRRRGIAHRFADREEVAAREAGKRIVDAAAGSRTTTVARRRSRRLGGPFRGYRVRR